MPDPFVADLHELARSHASAGGLYHEFLRAGMFSAGLYRLPAGGTDPQEPHTEDEIYFVVSGKATLMVGDESFPVHAGSVAFVPKGIDHRFVDIADDLNVLVFFAPPEGST